jgi:hypothetical protein
MPSTADDRAPHTAAQADVLMGQNAYCVEVGQPAQKALIENSCAGCHMVSAAPPAEYSYNFGGTNHDSSARTEIFGDCHESHNGGQLHETAQAELHELEAAIGQAIMAEVMAQTAQGNKVTLVGVADDGSDVDITEGMSVAAVVELAQQRH